MPLLNPSRVMGVGFLGGPELIATDLETLNS